MPTIAKHVAAASISTKHGTVSFVRVKPPSGDTFAHSGALKVKNDIIEDKVNSTLNFSAFVVGKKTNAQRALVKLTANNPKTAGVRDVTPVDGVLTITLVDTNGGGNIEIPVIDMPVTYLDDPSMP
ncbi:MAG: hypothetical protein WCH39_17255 [Schlesneria sp.]